MCLKSGKGFVFTLEALVALLCFGVFIASLASLSFEDYSEVMLYKETSDYAQIAMVKQWEHNESKLLELRELLGRNTNGTKCTTVTRTSFSNKFEEVEFKLCA